VGKIVKTHNKTGIKQVGNLPIKTRD